jgi:AcrR family transcriptional regulator
VNDTQRKVKLPDRGRPRSFDIDQALNAAQEVFFRDGYDAASMASLTQVMGINPPSLYAAFGSKEQLFQRVLQRYHAAFYGELAALFDLPLSTVETIESLLDLVARWLTGPKPMHGCLIVKSAMTLCRDESEIHLCLKMMVKKNEDLIRRRLQQGKDDGDLAEHVDTRSLAVFINGLIHGMASLARSTQSRSAVRAMASVGKQSVRGLVCGHTGV